MKLDKTLLNRLDKYVVSLLDAATDGIPGEGDRPPVEIADRVRVLDSVTKFLIVKNRLEAQVDSGETGGLSDLVERLNSGAPQRRASGPARSSRAQIGPGNTSVNGTRADPYIQSDPPAEATEDRSGGSGG